MKDHGTGACHLWFAWTFVFILAWVSLTFFYFPGHKTPAICCIFTCHYITPSQFYTDRISKWPFSAEWDIYNKQSNAEEHRPSIIAEALRGGQRWTVLEYNIGVSGMVRGVAWGSHGCKQVTSVQLKFRIIAGQSQFLSIKKKYHIHSGVPHKFECALEMQTDGNKQSMKAH